MTAILVGWFILVPHQGFTMAGEWHFASRGVGGIIVRPEVTEESSCREATAAGIVMALYRNEKTLKTHTVGVDCSKYFRPAPSVPGSGDKEPQ